MKQFIETNRKELGMALLLTILCVWTTFGSSEADVDALFNSRFLTTRNLYNIARQIGLYGIFSIGIGLVIITIGIDLSVGSLMALLGVIFSYSLNGLSWIPVMPWQIGLVIVLILAAFIGLVHGVLVAKFKNAGLCDYLTWFVVLSWFGSFYCG